MEKGMVKENAQRLVDQLGKYETVVLGYNCFKTAVNENLNKEIRIPTLETAISEYENQNFHDIAEAIYELLKEVKAGRA